MSHMPRDPAPEATAALLRDGYRFIGERCRARGSDIFRTRLLLQSTVCMRGPAAVRLFYDEDRFAREGAAPLRLRRTLFGEGAVQGLDGAAHRHRKQLFLTIMAPESRERLVAEAERRWRAAAAGWQHRPRVRLLEEVQTLLCDAVCAWAGVPMVVADVAPAKRDLVALIEGSGAVGPRHWAGRRARQRADRWAAGIIRRGRADTRAFPHGSPVATVAWHRDPDGRLLDEHVAAVELLNVLRPTVAVARYVVFLAHALHQHPEYRRPLAAGGDPDHERFVQEVRRHYPFFPFVAARVRKDFDWYGCPFRRGERALLDLYGTNHDARAWADPDVFRPERFHSWGGSAFDFVPQGGGDHALGHRCPGEWATIALMKMALRQLTQWMDYRVPSQDLRIDLSRMPALPRSGFVIDRVRMRRPSAES